jgi:4-coumarate--CoA ligase
VIRPDNKQFPEDIEGSSPQDFVLPYDLEGQSSKNVVASILFSSGTTGQMKGVKISHYNHIINLLQARMSVPMRQNSEQRIIFFAPCKYIPDVQNIE